MSKFNKKSAGTKTINTAGGKAYSLNPQQELIHAVLSTFLEDKFYESGNARLERIQSLSQQCAPEFVANLAVIARTEFNLRSVSHVLIGELGKRRTAYAMRTIIRAAVRPDDLLEIASYYEGKLPKQVKRGIRHALLNFNRYQLAKYRGEGKEISMVDLFNIVHPNPKFANDEQKLAWSDLMTGKLASFDTWETEISNTKDKKTAWEALVNENKMGYMALIRNLNNLIKEDVSEETMKRVAQKLANSDEVKKSKQLPFRFYTAYENVTGNRLFSDAIAEAMEHSLSNVPELGGRTLIAVDSSGSMTSSNAIQKAAIFAAALYRGNESADIILYDTKVKELVINSKTPVIDIASKIIGETMGGGTQTSLVFQYAELKNKAYDRIIIISDNESWNEGYSNNGVQGFYEQYKKTVEIDPFVYAIDIQGHGTTDVVGGKVFQLVGWSDRLLDFIGMAEKGDSMVEYVNNYQYEKQSSSGISEEEVV